MLFMTFALDDWEHRASCVSCNIRYLGLSKSGFSGCLLAWSADVAGLGGLICGGWRRGLGGSVQRRAFLGRVHDGDGRLAMRVVGSTCLVGMA